MRLNNFLVELKRRNVYKGAIAYGVVAWLFIQIASQIFPFFDIPGWVVRFIVLISIIGFPIALLFSWAFEMTPEGIKRTEPLAPNEAITRSAGRKLDILIIGVLLAAVVILIFQRVHPIFPWSASPISPKSIAVLPFENLSENRENEYFADGMHDEILTSLGKIADLKVISHTSARQYKKGSARNLREIGQQLGVAHLVEGTVQRSGGKVRVNAQLIDAQTEAHLWAQTYDRDLADVFAIQSEIAKAIADQLRAKLSPKEIAAIEERPTKNLVAYDFYLHATALIDEAGYYGLNSAENLSQAVELLNQAIALDPAFLLAYCKLAEAHDSIYWGEIDHTPERLALANAAINSTFRLKPDSGAAHLALAIHLYNGYLDYERAREELSSPHAPCLTMRESPNGVATSIADRDAGRKRDAISAMRLSWTHGIAIFFSEPPSLIFARAITNKPEKPPRVPSLLNPGTTTFGCFQAGSIFISKPILNHGMTLWRRSSSMIRPPPQTFHASVFF